MAPIQTLIHCFYISIIRRVKNGFIFLVDPSIAGDKKLGDTFHSANIAAVASKMTKQTAMTLEASRTNFDAFAFSE